jgi:hypothetical protein
MLPYVYQLSSRANRAFIGHGLQLQGEGLSRDAHLLRKLDRIDGSYRT